jgi:tetrahydromethanopterin S-methyltransferase subunit G
MTVIASEISQERDRLVGERLQFISRQVKWDFSLQIGIIIIIIIIFIITIDAALF